MTALTKLQRQALGVLTQANHDGLAVVKSTYTSQVGSRYPRAHWETAEALIRCGYAAIDGTWLALTAEGERMAQLIAEES